MKKVLITLSLLFASLFAKNIEISDIYIKQSPPNAKNTAIFLKIKNNTKKDLSLIEAKSDLASKVELHTHLHKDGKMAMVKLDKITIKANSQIELRPGADHIMLFDLKERVDEKTRANLSLVFDNGELITLSDISSKSLDHSHKH
ncbi:copper chaperone PCu(A)C [Campylobacter troglodytis]|uniref:copper chaperone PCu(A)C n=1 Tax=Campylobacter troglodytis TaxID=654363 RepID=UPI0011599AA9|nr:copper chaperone PCu(A)C [Campylobacter troglodytis]TQR57691.1 hypothetical protein DMC01_08360 [Campylobacter troglodytis]